MKIFQIAKSKNFNLYHLLIVSILISSATYYFTTAEENKKFEQEKAEISKQSACEFSVKRLTDLEFVKPILWVDHQCESEKLLETKVKITDLINRYKANNDINAASVYIRFNGNDWTEINPDEKYEPGSLFKVPILITMLKMDEDHPGFLKKQLAFNKPFDTGKNVAFASKTIQLGHSYSVEELLTYMIKYSDNNATILLESAMDIKTLQRLFTDIGLQAPNAYSSKYLFTVKEYTLFMRTIFNAGYLTIKNSEYAAELLAQCNFKEGLAQGLPKTGIKFAHKFGESGNQFEKQLHESGVVYFKGGGYLITAMTKGKDNKKLSQLLSEISTIVYNDIRNKTNTI